MALYEYHCDPCGKDFEQLTSPSDLTAGRCPFCHGDGTRRLISRFAVGGRGDLRESTLHGCHEYTGMEHAGHRGDGSGESHDRHGD